VNELLERLREDLSSEDNRYAYADAMTNAFVSAQIKTLKEDRRLTQEELAGLIGTQQSGISRLLRSDYSAWNVDTLRKLARAFGVRLVIRFEEFGTLLEDVSGFTKKALLPRKFEEDQVFNPRSGATSAWKVRDGVKKQKRRPSVGSHRQHDKLRLAKKNPGREHSANPGFIRAASANEQLIGRTHGD
jgi:transcriptional regulator with XRE-family HTH domain